MTAFSSIAGIWSWDLRLLIYTFLVWTFYLLLTGPMRLLFDKPEPVLWIRKLLFTFGLGCIYVSWGSPLLLWSHLLFSAHMLQMSLMYFFAPPLLVLGAPFLGRRCRTTSRRPLGSLLAIGTFGALFVAYHVPVVFDYVMTHGMIHYTFFIALMVAALLMWVPLLHPLASHRLPEPMRSKMFNVSGWLLMPACILLFFVPVTLFHTYTNPLLQTKALSICFAHSFQPQAAFNITFLSPLRDQQAGSLLMMALHIVSHPIVLWIDRFLLRGSEKASEHREYGNQVEEAVQ